MIALQKEYVEISNGKRFETSQRSDGDGGYSLNSDDKKITDYHQTFNLMQKHIKGKPFSSITGVKYEVFLK